jgi:hypothetical protein
MAKDQIKMVMRGKRRFDFTKPSSRTWESRSNIYKARGKKRTIGSIGICFASTNGPRIIGWIVPCVGGLPGRRNLIHTMKAKKFRPRTLRLTSDDEFNYPPDDWGHCVVWFDKKLQLKTKRSELMAELQREAKLLFRAASSELK